MLLLIKFKVKDCTRFTIKHLEFKTSFYSFKDVNLFTIKHLEFKISFYFFKDVALLLTSGDEKIGNLQLVFAANEPLIRELGQK